MSTLAFLAEISGDHEVQQDVLDRVVSWRVKRLSPADVALCGAAAAILEAVGTPDPAAEFADDPEAARLAVEESRRRALEATGGEAIARWVERICCAAVTGCRSAPDAPWEPVTLRMSDAPGPGVSVAVLSGRVATQIAAYALQGAREAREKVSTFREPAGAPGAAGLRGEAVRRASKRAGRAAPGVVGGGVPGPDVRHGRAGEAGAG